MCKVGGPRCPMDHKRRGEVNARRRTRDRATRAYRSGLVAALEEQGHDDLAKIARKAPSGDLAVMAAATGNTAVGEGLDYVPGLKRANEKISDDVASALNKIDGVEIDPDNRGESLESMGVAAGADAKDPFVTDTDTDTDTDDDGSDFDNEPDTDEGIYDNIDSPEKARAAADAMYAELEHLDRDELAAMDRDELEAMYNKYNAIDDAIRAQGDIDADETSGNAFLNLHDVYHGLDEDGLIPDDEDETSEWVSPEQQRANAQHAVRDMLDNEDPAYSSIRNMSDAYDASVQAMRDWDAVSDMSQYGKDGIPTDTLRELDAKYEDIYKRVKLTQDKDATETAEVVHRNFRDMYNQRRRDEQERPAPTLSDLQADAGRNVRPDLTHLYPEVNDDNRDELIDETNTLLADTPEDYVNMPQSEFDKVYTDKHDKLRNLGRRMSDDDHEDTEFMGEELTDAADTLARERQERDDVKAMFTRVNTEPDVSTADKADHAAAVAYKMATIQHPSDYSDDELAVKMENLNWIGDGVRVRGSDGAKRDFNEAYGLFDAEVAEREAAADAAVSKRAPLLADMDRNDFHDAMTRLGLEDNVRLGDGGTVEYDDITPLGKLKVANEVRSYERFREDPRAWGQDKYRESRADWDDNLGWESEGGSVYVTAEENAHGDDEVLVEGAYEMPNRAPFVGDEARRKAGWDMTQRVRQAMQDRYPDHPGNTAINVNLDESGEVFEATVPGYAQDYNVEPKHYYRALAEIAEEQFKRG